MTRPPVFIDSNVFLYLLSGDARKADRAEQVVAAGGRISVQILNEVTAVCRRKLRLAWDEIDELLAAMRSACDVVPITLDTHALALRIAQRDQVSFFDALVCAAAAQVGAEQLITEDLNAGQIIEGVRIVNPFAA